MKKSKSLIRWLDEISIEDIPLVGGKNASLGEMYRNLTKKGIHIPNGFTITSTAFRYLLESSGLIPELKQTFEKLNVRNLRSLSTVGKRAREIVLDASLPNDLQEEIVIAYQKLSSQYKSKATDVAVRSSATAEDLPEASFAGQQETFLNVKGVANLMISCKRCFASLYTNRAIFYRAEHRFDQLDAALSICVQKMVRSDSACSGVMFTLDTETGFPNIVLINGSYGLGENIVQGAVNPDEFYVFKPTLKKGFRPIIEKQLGDKSTKIVYSGKEIVTTKKINTPAKDHSRFCLTDNEILLLAKWAVVIEDHYSSKNRAWTPMDIEWAKDGLTGQLFILQARPETVQSQKNRNTIEEFRLQEKGVVITTGRSVGKKIGQGKAHVLNNIKDISKFKKGEVLVTKWTDPDWVPVMKIASAIVTDSGGRTSHAAIVSRELGLPCVVGTTNATKKIRNGENITVSCVQGEKGFVYKGLLKFVVKTIDLKNLLKLRTKIMLNVGYPEEAFELSFLPSDGVGLAREEFIINEYIGIHPMALVHFDKINDAKVKRQIERRTRGYSDKKQYFVDKLAMGVGIIAAAFYPRDVILRFSDFKTNEYANLLGGELYEPIEKNPMIGWRGASRYYKPGYKEGFALECKAILKVRKEFGLTNLKVMIPMCRTIKEARSVLKVMAENGLKQHVDELEVYMMCEIPSNVVLAEEFSEIFDGFSIGSNDLTQLTLGIDRDNELVADLFDERNEAVMRLIKNVIAVAKKNKRKIGICGDAPSTYPEFAQFLVDCGIDSVSLSPDAVISIQQVLAKYEKKKRKKMHR